MVSSNYKYVVYLPSKNVFVGRVGSKNDKVHLKCSSSEKVAALAVARHLNVSLASLWTGSRKRLPKQTVVKQAGRPKARIASGKVQKILKLILLLLKKGFIAKIPLSRAADIAALKNAKKALVEAGYTGAELCKKLICLHQLWTPRKIDSATKHIQARSSIKDAMQRLRDDSKNAKRYPMRVKQDSDETGQLVPGLCRQYCKPEVVLEWLDDADSVNATSALCCAYLDTQKKLTMEHCDDMVRHMKTIDVLGNYMAPHAVRSLMVSYGRTLPADGEETWGQMSMADSSVVALLKLMGDPSPAELRQWLVSAAHGDLSQSVVNDVGALALILCETHQVYHSWTKTHQSLAPLLNNLEKVAKTDVTNARKAFVKQKQYAMQGVVYEAAVVIAKHMGIVGDVPP